MGKFITFISNCQTKDNVDCSIKIEYESTIKMILSDHLEIDSNIRELVKILTISEIYPYRDSISQKINDERKLNDIRNDFLANKFSIQILNQDRVQNIRVIDVEIEFNPYTKTERIIS